MNKKSQIKIELKTSIISTQATGWAAAIKITASSSYRLISLYKNRLLNEY